VTVLPGPSAFETALVASGLVGERYQFLGYLPRRQGELAALWSQLAAWPHPVVAFESPQRLPASLRSLATALPERPAAVCRELTKRFEEVVRGTALELAERFQEPPRGEVTLVLGAGSASSDERPAREAVAELLDAGVPRRQAAELVSRLSGVPRNRLYRTSL
jgi:16S rRNA (cytidine1402-2'-O)-methyltransferase